jgi:hypothetical protein
MRTITGRNAMAAEFCPGKICAEIGVWKGEFAQAILAQNPQWLYLVDAWRHQPTEFYPSDLSNVSDAVFEEYYQLVANAFKDSRTMIIKRFSYDAVDSILDNSLDFCYIDACHWRFIFNCRWVYSLAGGLAV